MGFLRPKRSEWHIPKHRQSSYKQTAFYTHSQHWSNLILIIRHYSTSLCKSNQGKPAVRTTCGTSPIKIQTLVRVSANPAFKIGDMTIHLASSVSSSPCVGYSLVTCTTLLFYLGSELLMCIMLHLFIKTFFRRQMVL